ncbi:hypothetical protein BY458DRAFT_217017 [Sporodiniella umbellata]|nr:hypothetical protein BY458DRAFT_217017 [Sporodiniella umbellata]
MVSSTKTKDKKSCEDYSLLKKFPQELWNIVYSFLGINSLLSLSKTCRLHYSYIVNQSIWKNVAGKACIGEPKRKYKTYYELVSSKSDRICECCHTLGKPTGHQAVLPVRIKCLDNTYWIPESQALFQFGMAPAYWNIMRRGILSYR